MNELGWIKLHRQIINSELWFDVVTFRILIYLILRATHKEEYKQDGILLKRGEWIRSYRKLAEDLAYIDGRGTKQYSLRTIHRSINKLEKEGYLSTKKTKYGTLYKIVNYNIYQGFSDQNAAIENTKGNDMETQDGKIRNNIKNGYLDKNGKNLHQNIKLLLESYTLCIPNFIELNKNYWDIIRSTRNTGIIPGSLIYNTMKKWEEFDPIIIQYSLLTHIEFHADKNEKYTLGIMRRTDKHEAEQKLKLLLSKKRSVKNETNEGSSSRKYNYGF